MSQFKSILSGTSNNWQITVIVSLSWIKKSLRLIFFIFDKRKCWWRLLCNSINAFFPGFYRIRIIHYTFFGIFNITYLSFNYIFFFISWWVSIQYIKINIYLKSSIYSISFLVPYIIFLFVLKFYWFKLDVLFIFQNSY